MVDLPKYPEEAELAERGVRLVQEAVEDNLGWIFRVKRKADVGVDGEIEIVREDRRATGRLVSVQIKCGRSYLSERTNAGFIYRGDLVHLRYWLDHSLPVIVVLCDPDTRDCYWVEVTPGAVTVLDAGWKIEVPTEHRLNTASLWQLEMIGNRSYLTEFVELAVYRWLHEKYGKRIIIASIFDLPRDYHWYSLLAKIDREIIMIHHIYDRYGRFDEDELTRALQQKSYNEQQLGATNLIICLVSPNPFAFAYDQAFSEIMTKEPGVEFVRLLCQESSIYEIDDNDEIIDAYSEEGEPVKFGRKLFNN
jgi:hypothetical protein